MERLARRMLVLVFGLLWCAALPAQESPRPESWDYAPAMQRVASASQGRPGVVLHVGDSITYSNPYGQWARFGKGKTPDDQASLDWMHCGADNDTDGWWLARFDHPDGGRSHTAASGLRADQLLAGGHQGLPSLADMVGQYRPQIVVLMIGTNDVSANRPLADYQADGTRAVDLLLAAGVVPILSTIPPHPHRNALAAEYNGALRELARQRQIPLIDYEQEILSRRPDDWNGTLLGRGDVHPSAAVGAISAASEPTPENLRTSGYLLRGWLSVRKLAEVKARVFDPASPAQTTPATSATPATQPEVPKPATRPNAEETLRLPITRDAWFSAVGDEANGNTGGLNRLKLKAIQEMTLVDFDPAPLRGYRVHSATLWLRGTGDERLGRVSVGSFASPWTEGTGQWYEPQAGSSTFAHRRHPDGLWAWPGSDLTSVILGNSGTLWRFADATEPDAQRWQGIAVDPRVIAARVAGVSEGLFLFDDTGSEWTRDGEAFHFRLFPNRYVFSREEGPTSAPYLTVALGPEDREPPAAPRKPQLVSDSAPDSPLDCGRWLPRSAIEWTVPDDAGPAGVAGFQVKLDGHDVPRYLIPRTDASGSAVRMPLPGLGLSAGKKARLEVAAIDGAGNVGPVASLEFTAPDTADRPLPGKPPESFHGAAPLPVLGEARVAVIDPLDKVHPATGAMIPPQPPDYLAANHLFSARERWVRLAAARNEFVDFQVIVEGAWHNPTAKLTLDDATMQVEWGHVVAVQSQAGPLPDPVVPWDGKRAIPTGTGRTAIWCEIYVPHQAKAGLHPGRLTLGGNGQSLALDVKLMVWDFTLPDGLGFLPEMNCYGLPENARDYYRLAHRHRTILNRVPYSHRGIVDDGWAPEWDGKRLDWRAWDARFGPLFDGSAFADLPRAGVPQACFYLPLHENWPVPMEGNYNGSYWADEAFPASYRETFSEVVSQMAEHFRQRGWTGTLFQCYLNNKNDYKKAGWSRATSPWLLDEPASFQDYWALRYFGEAFHEGVNRALGTQRGPGAPRMLFRCDISRPEWQRDSLDPVLDYNVVGGGAMRRYHPIVIERKERTGQILVDYGSTNAVEESNVQPVGWCLDSWCRGSDGVVPWQTVGTPQSWEKADTLALFYPGEGAGQTGPIPSIRLKAYRRGQQDAEYLALLTRVLRRTRGEIGRAVLDRMRLRPQREGTGFTGGEDAGVVTFADLKPQDLWAMRIRLAQEISAVHPPAAQSSVQGGPFASRRHAAQLSSAASLAQPVVSP